MLFIDKGLRSERKAAEGALRHGAKALAQTPGVNRVNYDTVMESSANQGHVLHTSLLTSLLVEQGYLCAYCMRRIDERTAHIEHYLVRHPSDEYVQALNRRGYTYDRDEADRQSLNYRNLLAVCDGGSDNPTGKKCCDKSRSDSRWESIPLHISPLEQWHVATISYSPKGMIRSTDPQFDQDLTGPLNLNETALGLPAARESVLKRVQQRVSKRRDGKQLLKTQLEKERDTLLERRDGRLDPYVGIALWWLTKQIEKR